MDIDVRRLLSDPKFQELTVEEAIRTIGEEYKKQIVEEKDKMIKEFNDKLESKYNQLNRR